MKNVIVLFLLAFYSSSFSQIVNFQDLNLKKALVNTNCANLNSLSGNYVNPDANKDGEIQQSEADKVVRLRLSNASISNLGGIENFKNLLILGCSGNNLDSFIMINNLNITNLDLSSNKIKYLKLNNCISLAGVSISSNPISKENIHLNQLDALRSFSCFTTSIDTFNLNTPFLTSLVCSNLNFIDISKYNKLTEFTCTNYKASSLDVRGCHALQFLNCEQSKIKKLKVAGLNKLTYLRCFSNILDSLDLNGLYSLENLLCNNNEIEYLDFSDCALLKSISCQVNRLKTLDLSFCTRLENFNCYYNDINYINTKNGVKEKSFLIHSIPLKKICCDEEEIQSYKDYISTTFNVETILIGTYCSFVPGGKFYVVNGKNIFDYNNNGCDQQDIEIPYIKHHITNGSDSGTIISDLTGNYTIPIQEGTYKITPFIENRDQFDITPSSFDITFPSSSDNIIQDFCVAPKNIFRRINITVIPLSPPARPGFNASYKIIWANAGNQLENGTFNFTYNESLLDFVSATQNSDFMADGIIKWDFTNLLPFEKREIIVSLKVNKPTDTPAVNPGDKLYLSASIMDNIFTLENTVVGSFDPNDKTCLQGDRVKPDMVGEYVDYLVRFENTGNFAAENVVVKDIIDTKTFDVSSLIITDASHLVYTRIEGNIVEFIFENIQLPFNDANNDGYVAFKIKTLPTLKLGDSFKNLADIYFDYNFPVRTNQTNTTVAYPVFTNDITTTLNVYPNPVKDMLYFENNENWSKADIYDFAGRIIRSVTLDNNSVNMHGLENGTYLIKLMKGDKIQQVKFVKI